MRPIVTAVALLVATTLTAALPAPATAAEPAIAGTVTADLDGTPIPTAEIASWHCHDLDFPAIHCFATTEALDAAIGQLQAGSSTRAAAGGATALDAVTYVIVYAQPTYGGASLAISQDYDTLVLVGWNDRIRSFHAVNAELGRFWTEWFARGDHLDFCCNVYAPSLSATFDAEITSVYRR